jgi:hypothetical protein
MALLRMKCWIDVAEHQFESGENTKCEPSG